MTWLRQVLHVLVRDVQRTRALLAVYIVMLVVAFARSVEWMPVMDGPAMFAGMFVTLCVAALAAYAVIVDGTVRADAFWAVQPLRASAVAVSKVAFVVLLVAASCIAAIAALAVWRLTPRGIEALGVGGLVLYLLSVMLLASASARLGSVALIVVGVYVLRLFVTYSNFLPYQFETTAAYSMLLAALTAGAVMLLIHRYGTSTTGTRSRVTAFGSGVALMMVPTFVAPAVVPLDAAGAVRDVPMMLNPLSGPSCDRGKLLIPLLVGPMPEWRIRLSNARLTAILVDSTRVALTSPSLNHSTALNGPMLAPSPDLVGLRTLGAQKRHGARGGTGLSFDLTQAQVPQVCGRIAHYSVKVWVVAAAGEEVMRIPLRVPTRTDAPGYRVTVKSATFSDSDVAIAARVRELGTSYTRWPMILDALDYTLLNSARGELVRLHVSTTENGSSMPDLAGVQHSTRDVQLSLDTWNFDAPRGLAAWRDSAVLVISAPVERVRGWRTFEATLTK